MGYAVGDMEPETEKLLILFVGAEGWVGGSESVGVHIMTDIWYTDRQCNSR